VRFVQGRNRYGTSAKYGIAIHATANTASAANEAAYATRRTDGTSAHFYVDASEVVQSLDTSDIAGHAGSWQGNQYSIAVEITGLTSWTRARWLDSVAWDKLGAVLAAVARHHNIPATRVTVEQMRANPRVRGAYDHNQMRLAWGGTDHTDPGPNFPWDHLLAVWRRHLDGEEDMMAALSEKQQRDLAAQVEHTWLMARNVENLLIAALRGAEQRPQWPDKATGYTYPAVPIEVNRRLREIAGRPAPDDGAIAQAVTEGITPAIERLDEQLARRLDEIAALVERAERGELAADEVVREIGRKLTAEAGQE